MQRYRRLPLQKLYNCRDLGGYPTKDGKVTKYGVFLRSEAPCGLEKTDIAFLKEYGLTGSMDLRSEGEQEARPNELKAYVSYYPLSLFNKASLAGDPSHDEAGFDWGVHYLKMAEDNMDFFQTALRICLNEPGTLLYHCTTGKDRTGMVTCMLLSIAGVAKEDIAADYCVSELYLEPVYEQMRSGRMNLGKLPDGRPGKPPAKEGGNFFKTPATAMLYLIHALEEKYGSVIGFLHACGVEDAVIQGLHDKLVM